jgi:hypothetical protein
MQYASPASILYEDNAGHIQYGYVTIPIQGAANLVCFYNPDRSDAEVQVREGAERERERERITSVRAT